MQKSEAAQYLFVNGIDPTEDPLIAYRELLNAGFVITGAPEDRIDEWNSVVEEYKRLKNGNSF